MARAALRLGIRELAELAAVTTATLTRYENEHGGMQAATRDKVQAALETAGIVFLPADEIGPGIRIKADRK